MKVNKHLVYMSVVLDSNLAFSWLPSPPSPEWLPGAAADSTGGRGLRRSTRSTRNQRTMADSEVGTATRSGKKKQGDPSKK